MENTFCLAKNFITLSENVKYPKITSLLTNILIFDSLVHVVQTEQRNVKKKKKKNSGCHFCLGEAIQSRL